MSEIARYQALPTTYWTTGNHGILNLDRFFRELSFVSSPSPFRILDVGCGGGQFVRKLRQWGLDARGADLGDFGNLGEHFDLLPSLLGPASLKADVVTAWDVLEHIEESILPEWLESVRETGCQLFCGTVSHRQDKGWPGGDGKPLHLSVYPWAWWKDLFERERFSLSRSESLDTRATFFSLEPKDRP